MRLISPWFPRLDASAAAPSERLVTALADDIIGGNLAAGDRLPAHRDLADKLAIGIGTVTKAYAILERRGLVHSVKGRGTFVALGQTRRGAFIDISRNTPPAVVTERLLVKTLASISKRIDAGIFNHYPPLAGHDEHRRLMAKWFSRLGMNADPNLLVMTNGAHHALSLAISAACGFGSTLFTEEQTYPGIISLARHQGLDLVGIEMDEEGLIPEALAQVIQKQHQGNAALYVTPTMHNPTTSTMGWKRRNDIVSVCRQFDLAIIEDDVYSLAADKNLPPLAMLAPERVFYANSMSKTLNPALRIGGLVSPQARYARVENALQANAMMVSPLSCAVMEQWLLDGTAEYVSQAIRTESERRMSLAQSILGKRIAGKDLQGYHLWLPMSLEDAQQLDDAAKASGFLVTPPVSTAVNVAQARSGIRICLGGPSFVELSAALTAIHSILNMPIPVAGQQLTPLI